MLLAACDLRWPKELFARAIRKSDSRSPSGVRNEKPLISQKSSHLNKRHTAVNPWCCFFVIHLSDRCAFHHTHVTAMLVTWLAIVSERRIIRYGIQKAESQRVSLTRIKIKCKRSFQYITIISCIPFFVCSAITTRRT